MRCGRHNRHIRPDASGAVLRVEREEEMTMAGLPSNGSGGFVRAIARPRERVRGMPPDAAAFCVP
jgi:hypothetical protein